MAKVLGVSRSGFYYWIKHRHKAIQREANRQELDTKVKEAFDTSKGRDGGAHSKLALDLAMRTVNFSG